MSRRGSDENDSPARSGKAGAARFAYTGLDRLMHERSRLSILTSLAAHPSGLVFNDLKRLCALTDGNLSRQLQLLSEANLVELWKGQRNNRPQTLVRLTSTGRSRFADYLAELTQVLTDASDPIAPESAQHSTAAAHRSGAAPLPHGKLSTG